MIGKIFQYCAKLAYHNPKMHSIAYAGSLIFGGIGAMGALFLIAADGYVAGASRMYDTLDRSGKLVPENNENNEKTE